MRSREATRAQLHDAALTLFRERGYAATTVADIARTAGVSVQTLYLAWGSKRALLAAATDAASGGALTPVGPAAWTDQLQAHVRLHGDGRDAPSYLRSVAALVAGVADRAADLRALQREAAATEPKIAADVAAAGAARRDVMAAVASALPRQGLRPGLDGQVIADTLWVLAGPEAHHLLCTEGGYSLEAFTAWLETALIGALCSDPVDPREADAQIQD